MIHTLRSHDPFHPGLGDSPTLFVADDDDESRSSVCETLRDDGYDIVEARDGAELLDLLAEAFSMPLCTPDVVVANVLLPCYSGLGVLGALRSSHWDVPVILVTGPRHPAALAARALRLGAAAVFRRPFDMTDLRTAILSARTAPRSHSGPSSTPGKRPKLRAKPLPAHS